MQTKAQQAMQTLSYGRIGIILQAKESERSFFVVSWSQSVPKWPQLRRDCRENKFGPEDPEKATLIHSACGLAGRASVAALAQGTPNGSQG